MVKFKLLNIYPEYSSEEVDMLKWALIFFLISLVAGGLGFGGIAGASAGLAQILFGVFLVGAIIFAILGFTVFKALT